MIIFGLYSSTIWKSICIQLVSNLLSISHYFLSLNDLGYLGSYHLLRTYLPLVSDRRKLQFWHIARNLEPINVFFVCKYLLYHPSLWHDLFFLFSGSLDATNWRFANDSPQRPASQRNSYQTKKSTARMDEHLPIPRQKDWCHLSRHLSFNFPPFQCHLLVLLLESRPRYERK